METAFTFSHPYWGTDHDPQWWINLTNNKSFSVVFNELSKVATVKYVPGGGISVMFNSTNDLAFFILRYS